MKRKNLLAFTLVILFGVSINSLQSYPDGAPSDGRTGSPGDGGKTCAQGGCHSGGPTDVTGILSSDIPSEGYTPGASYTITVTVDQSGSKGFIVSPQKTDGTLLGSITAGAGNQKVGNKYITHSTPKSGASAVWTFTWVAPAAGTGIVDFYGAFANNRSLVRKTKYSVSEKLANGINENAQITKLSFYPNPAVSRTLHVSFEPKKAGNIQISLIDITGKRVAELYHRNYTSNSFEEDLSLPELKNGVYFMQIELGEESLTRKLLIQQ